MVPQYDQRNPYFAQYHDPIYASLDKVKTGCIFGHLTLDRPFQRSEKDRLHKWYMLIRDTSKRFTGVRSIDNLGWFLKEEGDGIEKRYHFHFGITKNNLFNTTPEVIIKYMTKQWTKITKSKSEIVHWDASRTEKATWYLTQYDPEKVKGSNYFHGEKCHWKMSTLLNRTILDLVKSEPMRIGANRPVETQNHRSENFVIL